MHIDINCDLAEQQLWTNTDLYERIMCCISSVNIACGFHAGTPVVMAKTIEVALKHGVAIGAHPGFYDPLGFGRRNLTLSDEDFTWEITYQIGALNTMVQVLGGSLHHIKLHGALYNMACKDAHLSQLLLNILQKLPEQPILYALSNSVLYHLAKKINYPVMAEVFVDRNYKANGQLVPRSCKNAIKTNVDTMILDAIAMIKTGQSSSIDGTLLALPADTICIHGDNPDSVAIAYLLKEAILNESIEIKAKT